MESVTLINIFAVPKAIECEFVESWHQTAQQMQRQSGFIESKLHRNLAEDGEYQYINIAQWRNKEALKEAQSNVEIFEQQLNIKSIASFYDIEAEY